jgi:hypothetical protein
MHMRYYLSFALAGMATWMGAGAARAQQITVVGDSSDPDVKWTRPALIVPSDLRNEVERIKMRQAFPTEAAKRLSEMRTEPWLGPDGQRLVGVVGDRLLSKPQLEGRVRMALSTLPVPKDERDAADLRVMCEQKIMEDWVELSMLALYAESRGIGATGAEVDQAIQDIISAVSDAPQAGVQKLPLIGRSDADVRRETHDCLIVDKMVKRAVEQQYPESAMRELYARNPLYFHDPDQVHAWHLYQPFNPVPSARQNDEAFDSMKKWARELRNCKDADDYEELRSALAVRSDIMFNDMGWVPITERNLPPELMAPLFKLKAGQTSNILSIRGSGQHVIKVIEIKKGTEPSYEAARPRIEAFLYDQTREFLAHWIQKEAMFAAAVNTDGLSREIAPGLPGAPGVPPAAVAASSRPAVDLGPIMPATPTPIPAAGGLAAPQPPATHGKMLSDPRAIAEKVLGIQVPDDRK